MPKLPDKRGGQPPDNEDLKQQLVLRALGSLTTGLSLAPTGTLRAPSASAEDLRELYKGGTLGRADELLAATQNLLGTTATMLHKLEAAVRTGRIALQDISDSKNRTRIRLSAPELAGVSMQVDQGAVSLPDAPGREKISTSLKVSYDDSRHLTVGYDMAPKRSPLFPPAKLTSYHKRRPPDELRLFIRTAPRGQLGYTIFEGTSPIATAVEASPAVRLAHHTISSGYVARLPEDSILTLTEQTSADLQRIAGLLEPLSTEESN